MVVEAWLARAAAPRPGRPALETPQGSLLLRRAARRRARAARGELAARGGGPGRASAIALPPGLDFAQALHACLLLGAVAVPVDLRLTAAERERIAAGARVRRRASRWRRGARAATRRALSAGAAHDLDATRGRDPHLGHHRARRGRSS